MYSIGSLCKKFNLSRSTLLYYDAINLLKPTLRTQSNYRQYSDKDLERLSKINMYRKTGIALEDIKKILESNPQPMLEKRLIVLNEEMDKLHMQQKIILEMLKGNNPTRGISQFNRDRFIAMLEAIGMSEEEMDQFHIRLEQTAPKEHQNFLEFLGTTPEMIKSLRGYYKSQIVDNN